MGRLREEFRVANFGLEHKDYKLFYTCKFLTPACFLAWRLFWALYHSGWLLAGIVVTSLDDDVEVGKWFIYLSNWAYILLTIDTWMEFGVVIKTHLSKKEPAGPIPWFVKITWCLFTAASAGAVMTTLWYWSWTARGRKIFQINFLEATLENGHSEHLLKKWPLSSEMEIAIEIENANPLLLFKF